MNPPDPRKIERAITIEVPVDAVWKALTDAAELTRWFPLRVSVSPGAGASATVPPGVPSVTKNCTSARDTRALNSSRSP